MRVNKREGLGVQHQAVAGAPRSIDPIADDRCGETARMRGVNAQLMRAAGLRDKSDAGSAVLALEDAPRSERRAPVHGVDNLARAIVEVAAQWQIDQALVTSDRAIEPRDVALLDLATLEPAVHRGECRGIFREHDEAAGIEIEPVDDARAEPRLDRIARRAAGHREQAHRLADDDQVVVLPQRAQFTARLFEHRRRLGDASEQMSENRTALAAARWIELAVAAIAGRRRRAPPELGERARPQLMAQRVRDELRRGAVTGAAGRLVRREQRAHRKRIGVLQPVQEVARALGAQCLQACAVVIETTTFGRELFAARAMSFVEPAALRGIATALLIERMELRGICSCSKHPSLVAPLAMLSAQLLQLGLLARDRRRHLGARRFERRELRLDPRQLRFARRPERIARLRVERRRHEAIDEPATVEHAGERRDVTAVDDQHAEHLALGEHGQPCLQIVRSSHGGLVGRPERTGHPRRQLAGFVRHDHARKICWTAMRANVAKCLLVSKVLVADGIMSDDEHWFLSAMMERLGLTPEEREAVTDLEGWDEAEPIVLALPFEERRELVEMLLDAAGADGRISGAEMAAVKKVAAALDVKA